MSRNNRAKRRQFMPFTASALATLPVVNTCPAPALPTALHRPAHGLGARSGTVLSATVLAAMFAAVSPTPAQAQLAVAAALPAADLARALALVRQAASARAPAAARIEVQLGALDSRLKLAPCSRTESFLPPGPAQGGKSRVGLRCVEGAVAWTVYLPVNIQVYAAALAPRSSLAAGTVLSAADLVPVLADWAAAAQPPLALAADLVGRTLARNVNAGLAFYPADLRRRQWFASGDKVRVLASGHGFAISTEGQALGDGLEGQPVRVQVLVRGEDGQSGQSGRGPVLTGRPTAERQVEVVAL